MKAVNLIPSDQRAGGGSLTGSSDGGAFIVLGLMAGLAVMALLYGIAHHQIASRTGEAAKISAEATQAQAQATQLAPYTAFVAMRNQRQQAISQLVESRFDWAHAFHELGRVLPFDVSLTSVHGSAGSSSPTGPATPAASATSTSTSTTSAPSAAGGASASAASSAVTSATPPGTTPTFTLVGCATSQSEVAQTLDRLRLMDGVSDVQLQSSTKQESGGGSSSGGSGGCASANDPSFTIQVTFSPLPTAPSTPTPSAAATAAASGASGSAATTAATKAGS